MIELRPLNLHWLENMEEERDYCAHSSVHLKIEDKVISSESSDVWTVSAAAYYFLNSLKLDHDGSIQPQLLPCCGNGMYAAGEEGKDLVIIGCPNGINWTITHLEGKLIHQFEDGIIIETEFEEWRDAVCNFSDEVMKFYEVSLPKKFDDEDEEARKGFELFMQEWKELRQEAFK